MTIATVNSVYGPLRYVTIEPGFLQQKSTPIPSYQARRGAAVPHSKRP